MGQRITAEVPAWTPQDQVISILLSGQEILDPRRSGKNAALSNKTPLYHPTKMPLVVGASTTFNPQREPFDRNQLNQRSFRRCRNPNSQNVFDRLYSSQRIPSRNKTFKLNNLNDRKDQIISQIPTFNPKNQRSQETKNASPPSKGIEKIEITINPSVRGSCSTKPSANAVLILRNLKRPSINRENLFMQSPDLDRRFSIEKQKGCTNDTFPKGLFESLIAGERLQEKSVNVQTERKIGDDGKWKEEKVETTTVTNEKGEKTVSTKTTVKDVDEEMQPQADRKMENEIESKNVKIQKAEFNKEHQNHFVQELLKAANKRRKHHSVSPLRISDKLTKMAREWAVKLGSIERMEHRDKKDYGENIYCKTSSEPWFEVSGDEVVENWYSEVAEHDFANEPSPGYLKSGHFSQMVWKDTKEVGAAFARNKNGHMAFVVAYFYPKGNWIGEFKDQVYPPGGHRKVQTAKKVPSRSSTADSEFIHDVLKAHNEYRQMHGVSPLTLDPKLNKYSQEWATSLAKRDVMEHRQDSDYGENLYRKLHPNQNHTIPGNEAVESWYSEIDDYNFGKEPGDLRAGHFTQVIWDESRRLGVGHARSKKGTIYVVANYDPAGNYVGEFAKNVPPLV